MQAQGHTRQDGGSACPDDSPSRCHGRRSRLRLLTHCPPLGLRLPIDNPAHACRRVAAGFPTGSAVDSSHDKISLRFSFFWGWIVGRGRPEPAKRGPGGRYSKEGCFIATAIYGHYDAPEVYKLRTFRDTVLLKTLLGRLFVRFYYSISPSLVKIIAPSKKTKSFLKMLFDKLVIPRIGEK